MEYLYAFKEATEKNYKGATTTTLHLSIISSKVLRKQLNKTKYKEASI